MVTRPTTPSITSMIMIEVINGMGWLIGIADQSSLPNISHALRSRLHARHGFDFRAPGPAPEEFAARRSPGRASDPPRHSYKASRSGFGARAAYRQPCPEPFRRFWRTEPMR